MTDKYNGKEYYVEPVELQNGGTRFELYVDSEMIITATQLERKGKIEFDDIPNWTLALKTFARAYIDTNSIQKSIDKVKHQYQIN